MSNYKLVHPCARQVGKKWLRLFLYQIPLAMPPLPEHAGDGRQKGTPQLFLPIHKLLYTSKIYIHVFSSPNQALVDRNTDFARMIRQNLPVLRELSYWMYIYCHALPHSDIDVQIWRKFAHFSDFRHCQEPLAGQEREQPGIFFLWQSAGFPARMRNRSTPRAARPRAEGRPPVSSPWAPHASNLSGSSMA